jgi:hypothetical protein
VRDRVRRQGGADAEALEAAATDPGLGAPVARPDGADPRGPGAAGRAAPDDEPLVGAATGAAVGGPPVTLLLAGLVLVSGAVGAAALVRRRRGRPGTAP